MSNKVLYGMDTCIATAGEEAYDWLLARGVDKKYPNCLVGASGLSFGDGSFMGIPPFVNLGEIPRHEPILIQCFEELGELFGEGIDIKDIGEETCYYILVDEEEDMEIVLTPSMMVHIN